MASRLARLVVNAILLLSAIVGFGNTADIVNTTTGWQRLVGVTATGYAMLAIIAIYGLWQERAWVGRCLLAWGGLVVVTGFLAAWVYSQSIGATAATMAVVLFLVILVVGHGWRRPAPRR